MCKNQIGSLYRNDVAEVKKLLHDIWILERRSLAKSQYLFSRFLLLYIGKNG
jgi:hypothetical protein